MTLAGLEIGYSHDLLIREERIGVSGEACRLLYVSDIHLRKGRAPVLGGQVIAATRTCRPDLILLGGDLVDQPQSCDELSRLVAELRQLAPVLAVGGNHDRGVGLAAVERAVSAGGGEWIQTRSLSVAHGSRSIAIGGPEHCEPLVGDARVLCAHHPSIWRHPPSAGEYDLVLAGHLHGCQLVAWERQGYLFPGAWVYPNCCLRTSRAARTLIVSRGVCDLIPVRWGCPREVVLCHV